MTRSMTPLGSRVASSTRIPSHRVFLENALRTAPWFVAVAAAFASACQPNTDGIAKEDPQEQGENWHPEGLTPRTRPQARFEERPGLLELPRRQARDDFYTMPGLSHGLIQSPVNILSSRTVEGTHRVELHAGLGAQEVINTGTTIELEFPKGTTVEFDGKVFELKQLHFHTPSEHQIDGITYPMEMHVVNQRISDASAQAPTEGSPSAAGPFASVTPGDEAEVPSSEETEYLVFGLLFKMGEPSRFIAEFLDVTPAHGGEQAEVRGNPVSVAEFVDYITPHYHYNGSLTTPPYTETVTWLVGKEPLEASPEQIQKINQLEGNNARHVQATYGRVIDG